jgi:hypothetical protein
MLVIGLLFTATNKQSFSAHPSIVITARVYNKQYTTFLNLSCANETIGSSH